MIVTTNLQQVDNTVAGMNSPRCFLDFQINADEDLGDMYLRPEQFSFSESVSNLFEGQLRLKANDVTTQVKPSRPLCFDSIIGKSATVKIGLPNPEYPDPIPEKWMLSDWRFRYFNGIITKFAMAEPGLYTADIKPDLFRLTLANRYHLFGQGADNSPIDLMTAVKQVLQYHKINFSDNTDKKYNEVLKRTQNWLQTGETDFEFIHRLLDKALVYYYFIHGEKSHQLVLSNQASYQPLFEDGKKLRYTFTNVDSLDQDDCVKVYSYNQSLSTSSVKTTLVRSEAAWEEDPEAVFETYRCEKKQSHNIQEDLIFHHYKIFQFSGSSGEAEFDANSTLRKITTAATGLTGKSSSPEFTPVHTFCMTNEPYPYPDKVLGNYPFNQDVRPELDSPFASPESESMCLSPELEKKPFVITSVHHQVNDTGHYENSFEATESDGFIAKFNIQSTHQGSIIAQVCKPPKKGSWKYIKKQDFHWSRPNVINPALASDNSHKIPGVWVKFSTSDKSDPPVWVKMAQHMQTVPEVGVTVSITRSNDDSETPEVSSIVQNNGNMVIMPSGWTANTMVGSSYSTNYGDSKRVSYGKNSATDLNSAVRIVEDQYNSGEYKDSSYSQGGSYSYSTSEKGKNGLLSRSDSFGNSYSTHHGAISDSYSEIDKSTNVSITGESINTSKVKTSTNTSKTDTETSTSEVGTSTSHAKIGTSSNTSDIGTSISHSKVGTSKNTSDTKTGINKSKTGINVNQSKVDTESSVSKVSVSKSNSNIKTSTSHTKIGTSKSTTNIKTSTSHSTTTTSDAHSHTTTDKTNSSVGTATRKSSVGSEKSTSSTGSSNSKSTIGKSVSMNATGSTTDISAIGNRNSISTTGLSTSVSITGAGLNIELAGPALSLQIHLLDISIADMLHLKM